jgi:exosortase A-associated hydrolase 2
MNKSRRMSARLARRLAQRGWRVVQRDLRGCGDSAGEFRDARWADWLDDLRAELDTAPPGPLWLWGVRAGALLAAALAQRRPDANLLLWQPVANGAQHLQQFLRLHAGARIVGASKGSETTPAQALRAGAMVEVGGYELGPALAGGLEQARLELPAGFGGRVVWFEISPDLPAEPSPAARRVVERLAESGIAVTLEALSGPPFWQTQEIEDCDVLLERSLAGIEAAAVMVAPHAHAAA